MLTSKGFIVQKQNLEPIDETDLVRDLTVQPIIPNQKFSQLEPFAVYRESNTRYRIPRFYGTNKFGVPCNKLPKPYSIDVEFTGVLKTETFQDTACRLGLEQLRNKGGGVLSLGTGFGKTTCALYILSKLSVKTIIIVHKEFLLNQWVERIQQFLPNASIGFIRQKKIVTDGKDIVIAMLQSLSLKDYPLEVFKGFGLTIIDETHHICSKVFSRALYSFTTPYILGLSATPERKDGLTKLLHWFIGDIFFSASRENQSDACIEPIFFSSETYNNNPPVSVTGTINLSQIINIIASIPERNELIINKLSVLLQLGRKILVLSDRRHHCETLYNNCKETSTISDNTFGLYMGGMKQNELKLSESCDVIFATYSLAHEGLDIPSLNTLILATPKTDIIQSAGRIFRENGGPKKFSPLIIDIIDSWASLPSQYRKRKSFYIKSGFSFVL